MSIPSTQLYVEQGATFSYDLVALDGVTPIDLTDAVITASFSRWMGTAVSAFTVAVTDAPAGEFTISLTAAQTLAMVANPYLFTVFVAKSGVTYRVAHGDVNVLPSVGGAF